MAYIFPKLSSIYLEMMRTPKLLKVQIPTHVDPGQGEDSVNVWEDPYYILPIVLILALLILYVWTRRRK